MSCGCGNYTPPIINPATCASTYTTCKNSSVNLVVDYICNNLTVVVTSPTNGSAVYNNGIIVYTPNIDYTGIDIVEYELYCNSVKVRDCVATITIEERDETTHTIELDACCDTVFVGEVISTNIIGISEIKINNTIISNMVYTNNASVAIQSLLNTYLANNGIVGEAVVTYDSTTYKYKFVISVKGENITSISIKNTGNTTINLTKTQCGCLVGGVTYNWIFPTNTTYVSIHEDSNITDCKIKVVLANDITGSTIEDRTIRVEICCGACTDNCCKIEDWTYNPPTYDVNCQPICDYPCTSYNPTTGNCDYICEDCENCCGGNVVSNVILSKTCTKIGSQEYEVLIESTQDNGEWVLASNDDLEEGNNCSIINNYQVFNQSIITSNNSGINFIYIDNRQMQLNINTDYIPITGGSFMIGYKIGICIKWYAFQILSEDYQSPTNHCNSTFVLNNYVLEHNSLIDEQLSFCNNCPPTPYYCADCCDNSGCVREDCPNDNRVCQGGECYCILPNSTTIPAPIDGTCCPQCTTETVPDCYTCINGVLIAPTTTCPTNEVYNYDTCQCECNCINGFCKNVLTGQCVPCPPCGVINGLYTCNGVPYNPTITGCNQCINGQIVPITCADGYIPNPQFNSNIPISTTNPCCISLTECDCENPSCPNQGDICTYIESLDQCYCINCTNFTCDTTAIRCDDINGCDCVNDICRNGCPTCTNNPIIQKYCSPFYAEFKGCQGDFLRFKIYELINLLVASECDYEAYINSPNTNKIDITTSPLITIQYNTTSSIFFNDVTFDNQGYIVIDNTNVQTLLLSITLYGINTIYEFVFDNCQLANTINPDTNLVTPTNPRIFRETCKAIYGLQRTTTTCNYNEYIWDFENDVDESTAIEIQDGKYIVVFPEDFPLGTTRELCLTANLVYDNVICSQYEECIDYTPCTGGCGCNPCDNNSNNGFTTNMETIQDTINGTVTASASVLLNCNGQLNALLSTCEAASSNEICDTVDNNGTSPLPFSAYSDYLNNVNTTPCDITTCTGETTGCDTAAQAPCGWTYDDSKLGVIWYNGANIEVEFINDSVSGTLCWGANYECGYNCGCITVIKELTCLDYSFNSASITCPPSITNTNMGTINLDVTNYNQSYTVSIKRCNTTTPVYQTTRNTSVATINIVDLVSTLGNIINGDCLNIKITFNNNGLLCEYTKEVTYNCCVTPTLTNIEYTCVDGVITEIRFNTNTAGLIANITTDLNNNVYNQITVIGENVITINLVNVNTITIRLCGDNTNDCCIENSIEVVNCQVPCIVDIELDYSCTNGVVSDLSIIVNSNIYPITINMSNNTNNIDIIDIQDNTPINLNNSQLTTLNLQSGDNLVIIANNEYLCNDTESYIIDCNIPCLLEAGYMYDCRDTAVIGLLLTIINYTTSYSINGVLTWSSNTNNPTTVIQNINVTDLIEDTYNILPPLGYPNNIRNCVSGTLTITDENDCTYELVIACQMCPFTNNETYSCFENKCHSTVGGQFTNLLTCKQQCEYPAISSCNDAISVSSSIGSVTERVFDLSALANNSIYYIDTAFGGKPEKYVVYQVDANNIETLLLSSPNLGCNCTGVESIEGFWTNVDGLTNLGGYDNSTVASITNPFIYSGSNTLWSGYIANRGEIHSFIPDDCTWMPHYNNGCVINANRDYDTCETCVSGQEESINAKALGRMYFQYDSSYGSILTIKVTHGTPTCNSGLHGVKFKLVCENTEISELYTCIDGDCVADNNGVSLAQCQQDCVSVFCESSVNSTNIIENGIVQPTNRHVYKLDNCTLDNNIVNRETNSIFNEDTQILQTMLDLPNVLSYGIGNKVTNGVNTKELAYIFTVSEKTQQLLPHQIIPKTINGYKTDVIVEQTAHTLSNCDTENTCIDNPIALSNCNNIPHRDNHKHTSGKTVMKGGISATRSSGSACTFSIVAKDNIDGNLVGIACTHCFKCRTIINTNGDYYQYNSNTYLQTSPYDYLGSPFTRTTEIVGTFKRDYPVIAYSSNNKIDACVINLDYPNNVIPDTSIFELTTCPLRWATQSDIQTAVADNWVIEKTGRTLGTFDSSYNFTCSALLNNYAVNGCYANNTDIPKFDEILYISQLGTTKFGTGGDSSSPVIVINPNTNEKLLAGILFAGSCNGIGVIPMYNIANLLNVSAWNGDIVVDSNAAIITVNGKQYVRDIPTNAPITHEID